VFDPRSGAWTSMSELLEGTWQVADPPSVQSMMVSEGKEVKALPTLLSGRRKHAAPVLLPEQSGCCHGCTLSTDDCRGPARGAAKHPIAGLPLPLLLPQVGS